jgi:NAD(P)-dependent dehydrogenase (short-subunit alcohol dehydrogenase family)
MTDGIERDGFKPGDLVVITGAGGGFGRAFCQRFGRMGAKIAAWDVNEKLGEETARLVRDAGGEIAFFKADLSRREDVDAAVKGTLEKYGAPYCIINNASIYPRAPTVAMTADAFELAMRVNIMAPFMIVKAFAPKMMENKRGVIINIASGRALEGAAGGVGYASSKGAILSFTKTLATEWAKYNIRCNSIVPGVSFTAQPLEATNPEELIERGRQSIPLGRIGYPDDMAGLAAFLVSEDASYMTGQAIAMNGGRVMIS